MCNLNETCITTIQEAYSSDPSSSTRSAEPYSSTDQIDPVRPFYNIAHMVNSIREVKYYLSRGANAIEADVTFSPGGTALYTFHGYPCDCFRHCTESEDIVDYLKYIRSITIPGELASWIG